MLCNLYLHRVERAGEDAMRRWRLPPTLRGPPWPPEHFAVLRIQHS